MAMKAKIIGYGVSGKAAESYLEKQGIETVVVADGEEKVLGDYDFCVVSPGVPAQQIKNEIVPVIPEVELPFFCESKLKPRCLIAVTGTNGKTTVVNQIYRMCALAKNKTVLCGNVGVPVSRVAQQLSGAVVVMEVSSFMLEHTQHLHPHIAVLTNITADHLDRHQNMEEYIRCKTRIVEQQTRRDCLVINWDDVNARQVGLSIQQSQSTRVIWYSTREVVNGYYVLDGKVWEKLGRRARVLGIAETLGTMEHTLSNALAVVAVGRRLKLSAAIIWEACQTRPQAHRMELVADDQGVAFYNDSKATNMAATLAGVNAIKMPICLILCGLSKGQDYNELLTQMPNHVKQILVFGAIRETVMNVAQALGLTQVKAVVDLQDAVKHALQLVEKPGVVLFSPSGSSFDQFINYEHRGDEFRKIVRDVIGQVTQYSRPTDEGL